jgi:hypothetical protein
MSPSVETFEGLRYPAISRLRNIYNNLQEIYRIKVRTVKPKLLGISAGH